MIQIPIPTTEADSEALAQLQTAVSTQLDRLEALGSPLQKRRDTVVALAWGAVRHIAIKAVLEQKETVSYRTYYNPNKDWYHNATFQSVLDEVTRLIRAFAEGQQARKQAHRLRELNEVISEAALAGAYTARDILTMPNSRMIHAEEGGTVYYVTEPANVKDKAMATLIMQRSAQSGRLVLGASTENQDVTTQGDKVGSMSLTDWRKRFEARQQQAADTMALFEEEDAED